MKAFAVTASGGPEAVKDRAVVAGNRMFRSSKRKGI
jgi:hypothetical protein